MSLMMILMPEIILELFMILLCTILKVNFDKVRDTK